MAHNLLTIEVHASVTWLGFIDALGISWLPTNKVPSQVLCTIGVGYEPLTYRSH